MNFNELTPQAQNKAIQNYITEFAPYEDIENPNDITAIIEAITINKISFDVDGNIIN